MKFCNQAEGKLYALQNSNFSTLEVISIHNDSLIVRIADGNMGRAEMTHIGSNCTRNPTATTISLPRVGIGSYVISDENKYGNFGCTLSILETSDVTRNSTVLFYSDQAAVGGCSVLLPDNRNNRVCGNHTCCVASPACRRPPPPLCSLLRKLHLLKNQCNSSRMQ